jgi:hypothetical protein
MTAVTVPWNREATDIVDSARDEAPSRRWTLPANSGLTLAVSLAVVGFALIGYTWWKVSDLTNLAKQMPYFVSGGLTGLGLVVLSAAVLVVVTRRDDEQQRRDQARALIAALEALAPRGEGDTE